MTGIDYEFDFNGKSILITGGTGSFGRAFVKRILEDFEPKRLIVYSRDEYKQYEMSQVFSDKDHECMRYFIGDVRDSDRLEMALRGVDIIIHAAALKHVPIAEYNPFECIQTNVIGAENIARAAIRCNVSYVVALSTDKAANPINLYGASKLASDKVFVAANNLAGDSDTKFSVVRYGNVIGSRGSVVPFFRNLVNDGATVLPITDPRMTRFFITLEKGVDYVMDAFAIMKGGEIFIPKIPSVKITDLASAIAPNCSHEVVGIRPGEKLHELMVTMDDARSTLDYGKGYIIRPTSEHWTPSEVVADRVSAVASDFVYSSDTNGEWLDVEQTRSLLTELGWLNNSDLSS